MATSLISNTLGADNAQVLLDTGQEVAFSVTITGTFSGTVTLQVLYDATEGWVNAPCFTRAGAAGTNTLTSAGNRFINGAGAISVRALMHPYVSGTAEVTIAGVPAISVAAASGGGGGAATIADGADVAEGSTTDAKVTGDNAGTISAKLRGALYEIGDQADTAATSDTGTFSLLAFVKRLLSRLTTLLPQSGGLLNVTGAGGTFPVSGTVTANAGTGNFAVAGDVASGSADSGNPVKQGFLAVAHGAAPTTATAGQRINAISSRAGVEFVAPGHPNSISVSTNFTGNQTNQAVIANSAGTKLVITSLLVQASAANTANLNVGIGLAQTTTPTSGTAGRLGGGTAIAPGSGFGRKTYQAGADGDQLLLTTTGGGDCTVTVEYHTTPS